MKNLVESASRAVLILAFGTGLYACAGTEPMAPPVASPQLQGEQMVWSSAPQRPAWTLSEPEADGGYLYFVGLSGNLSTEQLSRNDAMRDATNKVVAYLGTLAKDKFERARTSFGLSSTAVDPTEASRQFEKQLAANVAKQLKAKEWYLERWQLATGNAWKAFVLARMPKDIANESLVNTAEENIAAAQEQAKKAATDQAKQQAEDAAAFWKKMKEDGLME